MFLPQKSVASSDCILNSDGITEGDHPGSVSANLRDCPGTLPSRADNSGDCVIDSATAPKQSEHQTSWFRPQELKSVGSATKVHRE